MTAATGSIATAAPRVLERQARRVEVTARLAPALRPRRAEPPGGPVDGLLAGRAAIALDQAPFAQERLEGRVGEPRVGRDPRSPAGQVPPLDPGRRAQRPARSVHQGAVTAIGPQGGQRLSARRRDADDPRLSAPLEQALGDAEHRVAARDDRPARRGAREEPEPAVAHDPIRARARTAEGARPVDGASDHGPGHPRRPHERPLGQRGPQDGQGLVQRCSSLLVEEPLHRCAERAGEADRGVGRGHMPTMLEGAHQRPADLGAVGELDLGQAGGQALLPDAPADVVRSRDAQILAQ
jgi:hypothetical protein